jgi:hypothetical protein
MGAQAHPRMVREAPAATSARAEAQAAKPKLDILSGSFSTAKGAVCARCGVQSGQERSTG